jgi:hypothetical protein
MKGNSSLEKGLLQSMMFFYQEKNGRIGQVEEGGRKMKVKGGMKGEGEERRQKLERRKG